MTTLELLPSLATLLRKYGSCLGFNRYTTPLSFQHLYGPTGALAGVSPIKVARTDLTIGRLTTEQVIDGDRKVVRHSDDGFLMTAVTLESAVAGSEGGVR